MVDFVLFGFVVVGLMEGCAKGGEHDGWGVGIVVVGGGGGEKGRPFRGIFVDDFIETAAGGEFRFDITTGQSGDGARAGGLEEGLEYVRAL